MKKITVLILTLCMLMTVTGCNGESDKADESVSATASQTTSTSTIEETSTDETTTNTEHTEESTTEESETEASKPKTEIQLLNIDKKSLYEYEWSEEYGVSLAEIEYSYVLLGNEDAKRYPELAKTLSETANIQEDNMKNEYDMLIELAKESLSSGAEGFNTLVSKFDVHVRRADNIVLSVLTDSYFDNGMNGGSRSFWGGNYDTQTGKELFLPDVVTDIDEFAKAVETELFSTVGADILYRNDIIKEYFEMYGADGTHWTLDYNGVTMYFDEGEIADSGFGAMNVTVTFAEYPELFNEKYTYVPKAYIVGLPMKSTFYTDLDGDESCEELTLSDSYDAEFDWCATLDIHTAEVSYVESFWAYGCEPYYIKATNGKHYIYLFIEMETQMNLYVYEITNNTISKVGEAALVPYYNDGISAVLTDPNSMHFDIFSDEAGGGVSEDNDLFSIGADGMPTQV